MKELTWKQLEKYATVMGMKMSADYLAAYVMGQKKFPIQDWILQEWKDKLKNVEIERKKLSDTADNNNEGIALEKEGDIVGAIKQYETNISMGYSATHSYERLMVIYHKHKKFDDEIRVIHRAIEVFGYDYRYNKDVIKWKMRLDKLKNK